MWRWTYLQRIEVNSLNERVDECSQSSRSWWFCIVGDCTCLSFLKFHLSSKKLLQVYLTEAHQVEHLKDMATQTGPLSKPLKDPEQTERRRRRNAVIPYVAGISEKLETWKDLPLSSYPGLLHTYQHIELVRPEDKAPRHKQSSSVKFVLSDTARTTHICTLGSQDSLSSCLRYLET